MPVILGLSFSHSQVGALGSSRAAVGYVPSPGICIVMKVLKWSMKVWSLVEGSLQVIAALQLPWKQHENSRPPSFFMADEHFPYSLGMSLLAPLDPGMGSTFLNGREIQQAAARLHSWLALALLLPFLTGCRHALSFLFTDSFTCTINKSCNRKPLNQVFSPPHSQD